MILQTQPATLMLALLGDLKFPTLLYNYAPTFVRSPLFERHRLVLAFIHSLFTAVCVLFRLSYAFVKVGTSWVITARSVVFCFCLASYSFSSHVHLPTVFGLTVRPLFDSSSSHKWFGVNSTDNQVGTDANAGLSPNTYSACESAGGESMCCLSDQSSPSLSLTSGGTCRSDGLCAGSDGQSLYRTACTDQNWHSPGCIKLCVNGTST